MTGINKVIIVGRLGSDPEFSQTASGLQISRCSLATSKEWKDNQGEKKERTEWHRVVFFNRLAEIVSQYVKKGMQIYVEGSLRTNKWEKDGVTRYTTEIIAEQMQMLGGRSSSEGGDNESQDSRSNDFNLGQDGTSSGSSDSSSQSSTASSASKSGTAPTSDAGAQDDDIDEDIPF